MRVPIAVAAALILAAPLAAQATAAPAAAPVVAAKYTIDTPIETIVADPVAKAVLDKDMPSLTTHPMFDQFKAMSLKQLQPMSQGKITDAGLVKVGADLAALK